MRQVVQIDDLKSIMTLRDIGKEIGHRFASALD